MSVERSSTGVVGGTSGRQKSDEKDARCGLRIPGFDFLHEVESQWGCGRPRTVGVGSGQGRRRCGIVVERCLFPFSSDWTQTSVRTVNDRNTGIRRVD